MQFVRRWSGPALAVVAIHILGAIVVLRLVDRPAPPVAAERGADRRNDCAARPRRGPGCRTRSQADSEARGQTRRDAAPPANRTALARYSQRSRRRRPPWPHRAAAGRDTAGPERGQDRCGCAAHLAPSHASSGAPLSVAHLTCDGDPPAYPMLSKLSRRSRHGRRCDHRRHTWRGALRDAADQQRFPAARRCGPRSCARAQLPAICRKRYARHGHRLVAFRIPPRRLNRFRLKSDFSLEHRCNRHGDRLRLGRG